jgi:hypothetical protein
VDDDLGATQLLFASGASPFIDVCSESARLFSLSLY